jgi:hypothetical protein
VGRIRFVAAGLYLCPFAFYTDLPYGAYHLQAAPVPREAPGSTRTPMVHVGPTGVEASWTANTTFRPSITGSVLVPVNAGDYLELRLSIPDVIATTTFFIEVGLVKVGCGPAQTYQSTET